MRRVSSHTPIQMAFPEYDSYFTPVPQWSHVTPMLPLTNLYSFTRHEGM